MFFVLVWNNLFVKGVIQCAFISGMKLFWSIEWKLETVEWFKCVGGESWLITELCAYRKQQRLQGTVPLYNKQRRQKLLVYRNHISDCKAVSIPHLTLICCCKFQHYLNGLLLSWTSDKLQTFSNAEIFPGIEIVSSVLVIQ